MTNNRFDRVLLVHVRNNLRALLRGECPAPELPECVHEIAVIVPPNTVIEFTGE